MFENRGAASKTHVWIIKEEDFLAESPAGRASGASGQHKMGLIELDPARAGEFQIFGEIRAR